MYHNLCGFINDELKDIDRKVSSGDKLSMQDVQYADLLSHARKSLLTADAMENPDGYGYNDYKRPYMRNARRDGRYMGGYRDEDGMVAELRELMEKAPNERVRRKFEDFIADMGK